MYCRISSICLIAMSIQSITILDLNSSIQNNSLTKNNKVYETMTVYFRFGSYTIYDELYLDNSIMTIDLFSHVKQLIRTDLMVIV